MCTNKSDKTSSGNDDENYVFLLDGFFVEMKVDCRINKEAKCQDKIRNQFIFLSSLISL